MKDLYFKVYQRDTIWHYIRIVNNQPNPAQITVNFPNATPSIDVTDFDLTEPGSVIEYKAIFERGVQIDEVEFEKMYQLAISLDCLIYINGKKS